jgi:hypothetical protein
LKKGKKNPYILIENISIKFFYLWLKLVFAANRSESGRTSSDIAIDDISIDLRPLTTIIVTPSRPMVDPIELEDVTFDRASDTEGWHTDYKRFEWLQTNGDNSNVDGSYGPSSDWSSISEKLILIKFLFHLNLTIIFC